MSPSTTSINQTIRLLAFVSLFYFLGVASATPIQDNTVPEVETSNRNMEIEYGGMQVNAASSYSPYSGTIMTIAIAGGVLTSFAS